MLKGNKVHILLFLMFQFYLILRMETYNVHMAEEQFRDLCKK